MKEYIITEKGIEDLMKVLNAYCDEYHQAEIKDNKLIIYDSTEPDKTITRIIELREI